MRGITFLWACVLAFLLSGCSNLLAPSTLLDRPKYMGQSIDKVVMDLGKPYAIYDTKQGDTWIYLWRIDGRRVYDIPTGSVREGNTIIYFTRQELRGRFHWRTFEVDKATMKVVDMIYQNE